MKTKIQILQERKKNKEEAIKVISRFKRNWVNSERMISGFSFEIQKIDDEIFYAQILEKFNG